MTRTPHNRPLWRVAAAACLVASALTPGGATAGQSDEPLAPALTGLGGIHMAVTTESAGAQRFFDQGLRLLYAFNHEEARRAFREAARLDPGLAIAHWGAALTLSPTLNAPMTPESGRAAFAAVQEARRTARRAGARERALIEALASRFFCQVLSPHIGSTFRYMEWRVG
jgi:hypothetical protein